MIRFLKGLGTLRMLCSYVVFFLWILRVTEDLELGHVFRRGVES